MKRTAKAHWSGNLTEGKGHLSTQSSVLKTTGYSFKTRIDPNVSTTNPEELLAASHAGCFTMGVSATLTQVGFSAGDIETEAILDVDFSALKINSIHLILTASLIEGLSEEKFKEIAETVKENCLISKVLNLPVALSVTYQ